MEKLALSWKAVFTQNSNNSIIVSGWNFWFYHEAFLYQLSLDYCEGFCFFVYWNIDVQIFNIEVRLAIALKKTPSCEFLDDHV